MTTYHFTGPTTQRRHRGQCPGCKKKVTRSRTFERTVNPFNRHPTEDREKTWDEVRADVRAEADAWTPDFTCQGCASAADLSRLTETDLLRWIQGDASDRYDHRRDGKHSRAALCNQRIGAYEHQLTVLNPDRVTLATSFCPERGGYYCYFEFPDRSRCVYSERHGDRTHLSPSGQRTTVGAPVVTS